MNRHLFVSFWLVIVISLLCGCDKPKQQPSATTSPNLAELQAFWGHELQTVIVEQLTKGKYQYPEINERFAILHRKVVEQTGKPIDVELLTKYHWLSKNVEASAGTNSQKGTLSIALYVPAIKDTFDHLSNSSYTEWRSIFLNHMVIIFMHEMEHAISDHSVRRIRVEEESRAWAETCAHTIVPLIGKYKLPAFSNEVRFYNAWIESGGDTNSFVWRSAVNSVYGVFDGQTDLQP